jgi:cation:H+ antiporter
MNIGLACLLLVSGLLILWKCAELLVSGAVGLAHRLGVSPLIVGLTVVAMGTSAPEVAASIAAVLRESGGDIAIGNVYGSNIANLALVGGVVALIRPLQVQKQTLRREIPAMLVVALFLLPLLYDQHLSRMQGALLLVIFSGLILLTIRIAHRQATDTRPLAQKHTKGDETYAKNQRQHITKNAIFVGIGLVGLAAGAKMAVEGAVVIGNRIGLSKAVIGLTIMAVGTSLPELVTCIVAAVRGQHDISVGNLVGSNIFNTLLVTGGAGVVRAFEVSHRFAGGTDYWIMIAVSAAFAGAVIVGRRTIGRISGTLLLCGYAAYMFYLFAYRC